MKDYIWNEAHHIYLFAKLCYENEIDTAEDSKKCEKLWDLTNGITLCKICHKKTENYGYNKYTKNDKIPHLERFDETLAV